MNYEEFAAEIGNKIKQARNNRGLSQAELAHAMHRKQPEVARWESDWHQAYSIRTLCRIAEALGMELVVDFKEPSNGK